MHFYLTARHFDLTDTIRAHVQQQIVDAVEAHTDPHDLNRVEVQLMTGQRDALFGCHVLVQLPGHQEVNITEQNHDLYAAIDSVKKRLTHALASRKERKLTVGRHPRN